MTEAFQGRFRGRRVLITGHTGFKGAWLAVWLRDLGAHVIGYSLDPPSEPALHDTSRLSDRIEDIRGDILDPAALSDAFARHRPEIVLHLAAQALVLPSYADPRHTLEVNVMGTANVLEAARTCPTVTSALVVTSDKCYQNVGWDWAYRETDPLGGHDPYSASKAAAEIVASLYRNDGFQTSVHDPRSMAVASARAGNVIGGGDWAEQRIVPDTVRAIAVSRDVTVRHPDAIRPWQHVLDALSGYLWLAISIEDRPELRDAWNFGPGETRMMPVSEIVRGLIERWGDTGTRMVIDRPAGLKKEAHILRLDPSRTAHRLGWRPTWDVDSALSATVDWYRRYYAEPGADTYDFTVEQVRAFTEKARAAGIAWAAPE